jgi:preprotein translocase subunit YajC
MELILILLGVIFVIYYLLRPTSKEEKDIFNSKNNWRGGF